MTLLQEFVFSTPNVVDIVTPEMVKIIRILEYIMFLNAKVLKRYFYY